MNLVQRSCMTAALALLTPGETLFAGPSLRARPLPESRSFFVTTFGYDYRVTPPATVSYTYVGWDSATYTSYSQPSGRHMISSEQGIMHNLNPRYAVGFSNYLSWDVANTLHGGLDVRGRRWLDQEKSVDVTAGALLWGSNGEGFDYPGFVGSASLNFNDWENVKVTVTALPIRAIRYDSGGQTVYQKTEVGAFLGYQIAGKPGFVTTIAAMLTTGILIAVYAGSGSFD